MDSIFPASGGYLSMEYIPIPTGFLADAERDFDFTIYLKYEKNFIPYRDRNVKFFRKELGRLAENGVSRLYAHASEKKSYVAYLESMQDSILQNSNVAHMDKLCLFHLVGVEIADSLQDPHAIDRAITFIANLVHYIKKNITGTEFFNVDVASPFVLSKPIHSAFIAGILTLDTDVTLAAFLSDIGKLAISPTIVEKKGALTEEEWSEIRKHPIHSFNIAKSRVSQSTLDGILMHHENWFGTGYPFGNADLVEEHRLVHYADVVASFLAPHKPYGLSLPLENISRELSHLCKHPVDKKIALRIQTLISLGAQRKNG